MIDKSLTVAGNSLVYFVQPFVDQEGQGRGSEGYNDAAIHVENGMIGGLVRLVVKRPAVWLLLIFR